MRVPAAFVEAGESISHARLVHCISVWTVDFLCPPRPIGTNFGTMGNINDFFVDLVQPLTKGMEEAPRSVPVPLQVSQFHSRSSVQLLARRGDVVPSRSGPGDAPPRVLVVF